MKCCVLVCIRVVIVERGVATTQYKGGSGESGEAAEALGVSGD